MDLTRKVFFQHASLLREIIQEEMTQNTVTNLQAIGRECALEHTGKLGANQRNGKNSVAVAKTLEPTQAVDNFISLQFVCEETSARCVSCPNNIIFFCTEHGNKIPLSRFAEL